MKPYRSQALIDLLTPINGLGVSRQFARSSILSKRPNTRSANTYRYTGSGPAAYVVGDRASGIFRHLLAVGCAMRYSDARSRTVTGTTGASVPNAKVVIVNIENNQSNELLADESGRYELPLLKPGACRVTEAAKEDPS